MKLLASTAAFAMMLAVPAGAQTAPMVPVTEYQLPNGLKVIFPTRTSRTPSSR